MLNEAKTFLFLLLHQTPVREITTSAAVQVLLTSSLEEFLSQILIEPSKIYKLNEWYIRKLYIILRGSLGYSQIWYSYLQK